MFRVIRPLGPVHAPDVAVEEQVGQRAGVAHQQDVAAHFPVTNLHVFLADQIGERRGELPDVFAGTALQLGGLLDVAAHAGDEQHGRDRCQGADRSRRPCRLTVHHVVSFPGLARHAGGACRQAYVEFSSHTSAAGAEMS